MRYKKGCKPWNKGKECPSISESAKKRPMLVAGWNKGLPKEQQPRFGKMGSWTNKRGKDSANWKGGKRKDGDGYFKIHMPAMHNEYHGMLRYFVREFINAEAII